MTEYSTCYMPAQLAQRYTKKVSFIRSDGSEFICHCFILCLHSHHLNFFFTQFPLSIRRLIRQIEWVSLFYSSLCLCCSADCIVFVSDQFRNGFRKQ